MPNSVRALDGRRSEVLSGRDQVASRQAGRHVHALMQDADDIDPGLRLPVEDQMRSDRVSEIAGTDLDGTADLRAGGECAGCANDFLMVAIGLIR